LYSAATAAAAAAAAAGGITISSRRKEGPARPSSRGSVGSDGGGQIKIEAETTERGRERERERERISRRRHDDHARRQRLVSEKMKACRGERGKRGETRETFLSRCFYCTL